MTSTAGATDDKGHDQNNTVQFWNDVLYERLRDSSRPVFVFDEATIPAASIWTGSRHWVNSFREIGLQAGDRLVLQLPPGPAFIQVLVAAIWENITLIVKDPGSKSISEKTLDRFMAKAGVTDRAGKYQWAANGLSGPESEPEHLRGRHESKSEPIRLVLRTSGTIGNPKWFGLSDRNLISVLKSHRNKLHSFSSAISYLPWHHCFGLVLGLLQHIVNGSIVYRTDSQPGRIADIAVQENIDYLNTVPVMIQRLAEVEDPNVLHQFVDGIVGGAPITENHCQLLDQTCLRVGYGQTEASPGITLGERGYFEPNLLGQPVGCEVQIDDNSELIFTGKNAHRARFLTDVSAIEWRTVPRSVRTGDRAERSGERYFFRGRRSHSVKLPNGTFVNLVELEEKLNSKSGIRRSIIDCTKSGDLVAYIVAWNKRKSLNTTMRRIIESEIPYLDTINLIDEDCLHETKKGSLDRTRTLEAARRYENKS